MELPSDGEIYTLAGKDGNKRAGIMTLNKRDLVLAGDGGMPDLSGERSAALLGLETYPDTGRSGSDSEKGS